uniref:NADH-ubiquinone oxidoreductase chain 6 n=1 Tax=Hebomoia glaucippe TaxID=152600 RepID=M4NBU7_HEBGL|nr:NADH dehydrogenase subunit 6 [Hebomoia glaucippe]AGG84358.1 NADH dehydrogenase subunit 6 [Hebomoia glaucippe]
MLKLFISLLMIFFSMIMFFIIHPLTMGILILMQTILISILMGMLISTYWFSYILFLVFLGGLLVLFIYVSSIASNEMLKISFKLKSLFSISLMTIMILLFFFYKKLYSMNSFINNEMMNLNNYLMFFNENKINLSKLYNNQTYFLIMMLIIYLFITLIAVIKITNIFFGPLRSFN